LLGEVERLLNLTGGSRGPGKETRKSEEDGKEADVELAGQGVTKRFRLRRGRQPVQKLAVRENQL